MNKTLDFNDFQKEIKKIKKKEAIIVLAGGCFDILHTGHIEFLKKAKSEGDILIILLEGDSAVRKLKGKDRPVNSQENRAKILSTVSFVDFIIPIPLLKTDEEYRLLVKKIEPDIIAVTKNDMLFSKKKDHAKAVGGKIIEVIKRQKKYSTSSLVKQILR
ncbi:MAG: glycerol-3-phosphate cytidylyltransferase [Candidatus Levybacteria bacterium CG_4_10_14_0_2_um_filter_36_16]|nr:MAG: hypothetical protein AUK12_01755 [Candidatus Levybacteria bacterium CG2_30_37_29]PIR79207.1 MAG: glycerol-3-phosphate cytidylyltransferase [Candidatus Levybacteria bacterium CG10_big_fil_rev_8_21_14_0_10_36_30]PIZ97081.1 MAG: glycerol-3-phosphate cytidylyltransferase [Candidatus Levybacteria bacterium CG_4_10_14_0_2_um_filter_36_16]